MAARVCFLEQGPAAERQARPGLAALTMAGAPATMAAVAEMEAEAEATRLRMICIWLHGL